VKDAEYAKTNAPLLHATDGSPDLLVDEVTHGLDLSVDCRGAENRQAPQVSQRHLPSRQSTRQQNKQRERGCVSVCVETTKMRNTPTTMHAAAPMREARHKNTESARKRRRQEKRQGQQTRHYRGKIERPRKEANREGEEGESQESASRGSASLSTRHRSAARTPASANALGGHNPAASKQLVQA